MNHGDSGQRSEEEQHPSLTPMTRSDDWAATTGRVQEIIRTPGTHVGPYIVLDQLGVGGMGVVYAAYDPKLDRKVALKVLRSEGHDETAAVARLRLVSEGRALARVTHPNVVAVYDVGTVDAEVYVAMELVEGHTLGQWRKAAKRPWPEVLEMFTAIAGGLIAVHEASLVHRDVKPDNILIDAEGRPKVTDFGLARPEHDAPESLQRREQALINANVPVERLQLTQTGARLGTPAYMACEQLNGKPASASSDQYAFCVTLWETLYGERPFEGGSWVSLVMSVTEGQIRDPPIAPAGRPVPGWLRRIVARGLSPDPEDRWPGMRELRDALEAGDPQRARRRWWWGGGTLTLAAVLTGGVSWQQAEARHAAQAECARSSNQVADVWSDDARTNLRDAFARSSIDGAMGIETSVESVFDTFAASWQTQRAEVCLAGLAEGAPPILARQADCLDNRLEVLAGLIDTFTHGGDVVVSRARRTSEDLADLEVCSDIARLERTPPLPSDPDLRQQVREVDHSLMQTLVHEHVGLYDEGLERTRASLESAQALDHEPTIARAHYRVAVFEEKLGNYERAVDSWVASFRHASLSGDDDLAAQAAGALAFTEGYQLARHDTGIRWSELAGILLQRLGKTETLDEARRLDVLAILTESKGRLDEAVTLHRRSIALRESLVPPTHQSIGYGLANLAGVLENQGKLEEAEKALLRSRAIFENAFGVDNPTTAHVVNNLANLYREQRRYDEALTLLRTVLDNWRARLGPDHPDVGGVHRALGDVTLAQGKIGVAVGHYRDALAVHEKSDDAGQAREHAKTALRLAEALVLSGQNEEAKQRFDEALESADSKAHRLRGDVLLGSGWLAFDRGETEAARVHFERARALFEGDDRSTKGLHRARIALGAVTADPATALTQWRALVEDASTSVSVRAEALAWIVRNDATPEDERKLDALLEKANPADALRIRKLLEKTHSGDRPAL